MNRRIVIFALLCVLALGGISAAVHMHNKTGNQEKMNTDGCIITQYSDVTGRQGELLYNYEQWTFDYYRWWMG